MSQNRQRGATLLACLLVLIFLFVHACVPEPITDLQALRVNRVSASALPLKDSLRDDLIRRGEVIFKISFSGNADWIQEVRKHELNSYALIVRCDHRDETLFALGPYVGQVPVTYYGNGFNDYRPISSTVQYDVYLPETGSYRSDADINAPMPRYDLGKQRITLCIRIAGGAMYGAYNRSNEVRLDIGNTK